MRSHLWRACLAIVLLVSGLSLPSTAKAQHQPLPGYAWIKDTADGYTSKIGVCPPMSMNAWDTAGNNKHARIWEAISDWNALDGELFFYKSPTDCNTKQENTAPYVRIVWDTDDNCDQPIWDCGVNGGQSFAHTATEFGANADAWSGDGSGACPEGSNGECIVHYEIRLDYDDYDDYNFGNDDPTSTQIDFESLILHEMGHVVSHTSTHASGSHCPDSSYPYSGNDVMCAVLYPGERRRTLTLHDKTYYSDIYGFSH